MITNKNQHVGKKYWEMRPKKVFPHDDQADDFRENYEDETEPPNITKTKESA